MNFLSAMTVENARNLNPLVLAYVGDAVHSLIVREKLTLSHDYKAGIMHKNASLLVNAHSQAQLAQRILPMLNESEQDIFRRARNSKNHHTAKNQTRDDYKLATAIEAVIGYLYLIGQTDRLLYLLQEDIDRAGNIDNIVNTDKVDK